MGSATSHAAIVAREYSIPAVVAIENVTNTLKVESGLKSMVRMALLHGKHKYVTTVTRSEGHEKEK
ncbi:PEP-utilizing enzyme [Paenibacillus azoreducens]|uniref:PEP-utilizing enzyme n=1 Tax=Paenibacillus azoreducens TaxID=116718 RepID=UPI0039F5A8DF